MRREWMISALAGASTGLLLACGDGGTGGPDEPQGPASPGQLEARAWLERAAEKLRHGRGLGPEDDVRRLVEVPREEALDVLLDDPRVEDMVFDFNLYFLGFEGARFRDDAGNIPTATAPLLALSDGFVVTDYPAALASVRAFSAGGDYLVLLDFAQPTFVAPLFGETFSTPALDSAAALLDEAERLLDPEAPLGPDPLAVGVGVSTGSSTRGISLDAARARRFCSAVFQVTSTFALPTSVRLRDPFFLHVLSACARDEMPADAQSLVARLRRRTAAVRAYARQFVAEEYVVRAADGEAESFIAQLLAGAPASPLHRFSDVRTVDPALLDLPPGDAYGARFWASNPNSSTNYDRKRSAYVLDRYFCDDLKPIAVPLPEHDRGGAHATASSCQSCHYKLDPMAGFFRELGFSGISFRDVERIVFDDGASVPRGDYVEAWRGEARAWEVGYIRSATNPAENAYGESLEDLHRIIRHAPEVKRCLVQRMFEYLVGADQIVDPGYLDALTEVFMAEAEVNGSTALRGLVKAILLSNSFSVDEPRRDECYDFAPDASKEEDRPPCEVAAILEKNCVGCHSGAGAPGGLELGRWVPGEEGPHFPHFDGAGGAVPRAESLARISERLSTSDPARSMPLGRPLRTRDREALLTWLSGQLEEGGSTP